MRRAAIVSPVRTPVGAFGGALRDVPVETLGSVVTTQQAQCQRLGHLARASDRGDGRPNNDDPYATCAGAGARERHSSTMKWLACRRRQRCELFALDRPPSRPIASPQ